MEKIKNILNSGKILKFICGAGNEDCKEIEKLSFVFASAGFNMIDVSAKSDAINSAKSGIKKAGKENDVAICVSIGLPDDIHLKKAVINLQKCTACKECINICPQNALFCEDEKIYADEKKCIGCSRCAYICKNDAVIFEHKYKAPYTMILPLLAENIDCIEYHCSIDDENIIHDNWNKIKSVYDGCLSICLDRSKLGDDKIIFLLKEMIKDDNNIIIQADGKPMSGGKDDYKSNLQTVAFAEIIRNNNLPAHIILSGGTNSKTTKFAKECNISVDGVALGSFARKLVKEYISSDDFFLDKLKQQKAINIAQNLLEELKKYL